MARVGVALVPPRYLLLVGLLDGLDTGCRGLTKSRVSQESV